MRFTNQTSREIARQTDSNFHEMVETSNGGQERLAIIMGT
jgi:hypothetical protein